MPRATLAPGFIRIKQQTTISSVVSEHSQDLGIAAPSWSGATTTIQKKDGGVDIWSVAAAAYIAVWKALFAAATTFTIAELWRMDTPTSDPSLVSTQNLGVAGTNGGASQAAVQGVYAFRGADDSGLRLTTLEAVRTHNARLVYAGLTAAEKAVVDFVIGTSTWLYTRGNSFPVTFSLLTTKVNDKLREQRLNL